MGFLIWLEQTGLSTWIRESASLSAFPFILYLHTLGLAMLVGIAVAFAIWVLGFAGRYPIAPLRQYVPLMWVGFAINAVSGVLLLVAYPAKALTNPVFYVKLGAIFAAVVILQQLDRRLFVDADPSVAAEPDRATKWLAAVSLLLWAIGILTGRLLAYTHSVLTATELVR